MEKQETKCDVCGHEFVTQQNYSFNLMVARPGSTWPGASLLLRLSRTSQEFNICRWCFLNQGKLLLEKVERKLLDE